MKMTEYLPGLYILDDERVRCFFIESNEQALLIDTGFQDNHVFQIIKEFSNVPVQVVLTHADRDHAGGLDGFEEAWLHEKDWHLVQADVQLHPLKEGDHFKAGDYDFEVIEIPGHTFGSCAFFDRAKGLLISGDSIQDTGPIYLFGSHRNIDLYIESQKKLEKMADQFLTILPSHHAFPADASWIKKNRLDAEKLKDGKLSGVPVEGMPCLDYAGDTTHFLYEERI